MIFNVLSVTQLEFSLNNKVLLHDLNFKLKKGEMLWVKGANGSGKSTLLKLLAGLHPIGPGQVYYNQFDYHNAFRHFKAQIGLSSPPYPLLEHLSVKDYFNYILVVNKLNRKPFTRILNQLNLIQWENCTISSLSTGLKQRISLAQSLMHQPSLLLLDEPNANLDKQNNIALMSLLKSLNPRMGIIVASHQTEDWQHMASHCLELKC